jgi:hypothetical protein
MLLTAGQVAIEIRQVDAEPHRLAVIEAEELLGEMALFGDGRHSTDVRVIGGPAELVVVQGDSFIQALLFDVDLAIELLSLVSQRCMRSNGIIGLLLDGIAAAERGDSTTVSRVVESIKPLDNSLELAGSRLERLTRLQ